MQGILGLLSAWLLFIALSPVASGQIGTEAPAANPASQACKQWKELVSRLEPSRRKTLDFSGVVWAGDLILGEALVPDCPLRLSLGRYFTRVLAGETYRLDGDRLYARGHSREIARVLSTIWPIMSRVGIGDGAFDDMRYAMLREPSLRDSDWQSVGSSVLRSEKISAALTAIILDRPSQSFIPGLRRQLQSANSRADVGRQIYCLVCLQAVGEPVVGTLRELLKKRGLTEIQEAAIRRVLDRIERTGRTEFEDVADLEYDDEAP